MGFAAPEIVNRDAVGYFTDMWAVGVLTYILLSGLSPFAGNTDNETLKNVKRCEWAFDPAAFRHISAYVHWACPKRRGVEDHARTEADQSWSEDQVQGIRCYWRLQRPRWTGCEVLEGGCHCYPWRHHSGQALHCASKKRFLG